MGILTCIGVSFVGKRMALFGLVFDKRLKKLAELGFELTTLIDHRFQLNLRSPNEYKIIAFDWTNEYK